MFSSGFQLLNNVNLMELCEPEYYGRVMAITMMSFGLNSIAAFPFGLLADAIGERQALMLSGGSALGVVALGVMLALRIPRSRVEPLPAATPAGARTTRAGG
jgi:hypothetical protein